MKVKVLFKVFSNNFQVNEDEESATIKQLRQQVMTLTSSMATLSQEKSKMEANYLGEKKKMRVSKGSDATNKSTTTTGIIGRPYLRY